MEERDQIRESQEGALEDFGNCFICYQEVERWEMEISNGEVHCECQEEAVINWFKNGGKGRIQ